MTGMDIFIIIAAVVVFSFGLVWFFVKKEDRKPAQTKMGDYSKYFKCIKCGYVPEADGGGLLCCPKCRCEQHKMVVGRWEYRVIIMGHYLNYEPVKFHPLVPCETER